MGFAQHPRRALSALTPCAYIFYLGTKTCQAGTFLTLEQQITKQT